MELIVNETQEFMGIEIPVIEGGFGEGKRCISVKDIAKIHKTEIRTINQAIKRHIDKFEYGIDILDIKRITSCDAFYESLGMTKAQVSNVRNVYLLSESGYTMLCMFMRGKAAKDVRVKLVREYFAMRATIASQSEYISVLEEKNKLLEENSKLLKDNIKLNERITTACQIPRTHLIKDIKIFMNKYTSHASFAKVTRTDLYDLYINTRISRDIQPTMSQFEDVVYNLGYFDNETHWLDIVIKNQSR